jgi:hypothetical protein
MSRIASPVLRARSEPQGERRKECGPVLRARSEPQGERSNECGPVPLGAQRASLAEQHERSAA